MKTLFAFLTVCLIVAGSFAGEPADTIHYHLAMKLLSEKKYDASIEEFRKMLTLYPDHEPSYYQMALAWNAQGKYALGIYNLKKADKLKPMNPELLKVLSDTYAKNNEPEKAMSALRASIDAEKNPEAKAAREKEMTGLLQASKQGGGIVQDTALNAHSKPEQSASSKAGTAPAVQVSPTTQETSVSKEAQAKSEKPASEAEKEETSKDPELQVLLEKFNKGLLDEALAEAKRVIKKNHGHAGAFYYAGLARYKKGDFRDAIINLQKGATYPEKGVNAFYYLGLIQESQGKIEEALSAYQQFLNKSPSAKDKETVRLKMSELLKKAKTAPSAAMNSASTKLPKEGHSSPSGKPQTGNSAEGAASPDSLRPAPFSFKIADNLEFTIEDTMKKEGRQMLSALDLFLDARYDGALNELKALYREAPHSREADNALFNTGLIYSRMRLWDNAVVYLSKVLTEYPRGDAAAAAAALKAYALAESGSLDSALLQCGACLTARPKDKFAGYLHTLAGNIRIRQNDYKNALKSYLSALPFALTPEAKADINYKIGECYFKDNSTKGIEFFRQAAADSALKSDAVMESCYRLGDYYYKIKNMEGALKYYRQAVDRFPQSINTPWGLYQIGNVYKKGGRFDEAVKIFDQLAQIYPGDYWTMQAKWQREDAIWENEYRDVLK